MATYTTKDLWDKIRNGKDTFRGFSYDDWKSHGMLDPNYEHGYFDDDYLAEIEKYKNESWYNYLLTNPWLAGNQASFSPNTMQNIAEAVGNYSARDKYYAELRSNRSQWLSEFVEKMRQQSYNEPISQVQRDLQAGLNPDLAGNVDSGSAAENDQPLLGHPSFDNDTGLGSIASFFMSIYSLASGFAKDMMSFQSMQNQLVSEDLNINKDIVDATTNFIKGHIGEPILSKDDDGSFRFEFPELVSSDLQNYANKMFNSRSTRKRFIKEVNSSWASARGAFARYGAIRDSETAKRAMSESIGFNSAYGINYNKPSHLDPIISTFKRLNSLALDIQEYQSKYTSEYFHSASGNIAGEAVNAQNEDIIADKESRSYQRGMDKIINKTMSKIVSDLEKGSYDSGLNGLISKGMLMYLSAYRLQMLPSLPKINLDGLLK